MSATETAPFDPQQYDRLSGSVPGYAALQELVALAAAATAPSSHPAVLDLGCGTGAGLLALALALARSDPRLTACDPSPPMVATARSRCAAAGVTVELVVGDLSAVAPDARFDVIVCTLVFHFVPPDERSALLSAIRARLRPGGSLVISALGRSRIPPCKPSGCSSNTTTRSRVASQLASLRRVARRSSGRCSRSRPTSSPLHSTPPASRPSHRCVSSLLSTVGSLAARKEHVEVHHG